MIATRSLPIPAVGDPRRRPARLHEVRLRRAILDWYDARGRALAFRETTDPWAILVSEVMAQQTQVARVGPAWRAFLERFPTPRSLASAVTSDVLRAWSGLGYNRRAVALQRSAIEIAERHGGTVPDDLHSLEALPGIGPYTARAVLAIAFGRRVGAVDVNVRRVLTRVFGPTGARLPPASVQALADELVPARRPGDWTHALMDLGAMVCRPRDPRCAECPARRWCAFATGRPDHAADAPVVGADRALRVAPTPFPATTRWLRGRIVDRLATAEQDRWTPLVAPIGTHDVSAIRAALLGLERDGIVELRPDGETLLARLPSRPVAAG